ncbi:hypothetical protein CEXT_358071 [Caerostris extrusa]|uniref:Uncharacterized protein n=1 Tax=Caerostris extrusa TaxID=172846 RepID=A0AAV4XPJ2_CAEEX|nr:hypothetical protein CEXT_358071 [Caerostris extrusa]
MDDATDCKLILPSTPRQLTIAEIWQKIHISLAIYGRFDFDDTKVVQKKYEVWADHPTESALTCAVYEWFPRFRCGRRGLRRSQASRGVCEEERSSVSMNYEKGWACKDDQKPYLKYGDNCLFVLSGALGVQQNRWCL